jgi:hypothetical protein
MAEIAAVVSGSLFTVSSAHLLIVRTLRPCQFQCIRHSCLPDICTARCTVCKGVCLVKTGMLVSAARCVVVLWSWLGIFHSDGTWSRADFIPLFDLQGSFRLELDGQFSITGGVLYVSAVAVRGRVPVRPRGSERDSSRAFNPFTLIRRAPHPCLLWKWSWRPRG